jgi:hypothetical protein
MKRSPVELVLLSVFLPLAPVLMAGGVGVALVLPLRDVPSWLMVGTALAFVVGLVGTPALAHEWFPPSRAYARTFLALASLMGVVVFAVCARASGPRAFDSESGGVPSVLDMVAEGSALVLAYGGMWVGTLVVLWAKRRDLYG